MTKVGAGNVDFTLLADSLYHKAILRGTYDLNADQLLAAFEARPDSTMAKYGNRLGIGQSSFFMVTVQGTVSQKSQGGFVIHTDRGEYLVDTKYIFGNAIRDASGLVKLTDFKTNAEFNKLSEALNDLIREKSIPTQHSNISDGDLVKVTGALKLSKKAKEELRIQPVSIEKGME